MSVQDSVLVGTTTHDDAAVYRLGDDLALVATVDVFTPIVDDARDFGRIAAANSLSDVYAMGGEPLFALSVVGFPTRDLPIEDLGAMLAGAAEVAAEAGIGIVGGHSIDDPEPKFGLCVIGRVHPERVARNDGARPGQVLLLTKPLGSGVIATAIKRGVASAESTEAAIATMVKLNRDAAAAMMAAGVRAATDVTGFGLLGHLHELAHASGVRATLFADAVPLLPGARELAEQGVVPGGSKRNLEFFGRWTRFAADVDGPARLLLADAQTSGGLLIAADPEVADALEGVGVRVGRLESGPAGEIEVVRGRWR